MRKLFDCPYCGGCPIPKRVGDNKEYIVYVCEGCGKTPVNTYEARLTAMGAADTWNMNVEKYFRSKKGEDNEIN